MSLHRRAAKRDAAEPAIVSALEALGCIVWRVSGKGLPDLIVLRAGKKWLADVKGPKEKPTPAQVELWTVALVFARCAVFILRTPEDAQKMLNNALQPWEPAPPRIGKDGRLVLADLKGNARMVEIARRMRAKEPVYGNLPRKGDAAKARGMYVPRNGRDAKKTCGCLRSLGRCEHSGNYTPPQELVDGRPHFNGKVTKAQLSAAKEAEATFAPPERPSVACCGLYETVGEHDSTCDHFVG